MRLTKAARVTAAAFLLEKIIINNDLKKCANFLAYKA
jgi:hypothetical protein